MKADFLGYVWTHRRGIGFGVFACAVFAVTFRLFQLPAAAVLYAALINAAFGLGLLLAGYFRFRRRHAQLQRLLNEIAVTTEHLPPADTPIAQEYTALLLTLFACKQQLADEMNAGYQEMVDYYTIWVHQIKTPISAMRLNLQSADTPQNRELSEDLQRIEQYVEMVLCYLRVDSVSTDFVIRSCSLDDILRQAIRKFSAQFIRRKIKLCYEPLDCMVLTDEKWLLFVVEQLLSNALKYTRSGSITITLAPEKVLCIQDTGIGIAAEDLPRIFERGYTGYNGRSDRKASGIGLYLCKRICDKFGYGIAVTSTVDVGTMVQVCLQTAELEAE